MSTHEKRGRRSTCPPFLPHSTSATLGCPSASYCPCSSLTVSECRPLTVALILSLFLPLTRTSVVTHADIRKHPLLESAQSSPHLSWELTPQSTHCLVPGGRAKAVFAGPKNLPDWKAITFFFFFFGFLGPYPRHMEVPRLGRIVAVAPSLCHSHSNARFKPETAPGKAGSLTH